MIICNNNSIDIIQGVIGYGNAEGITDWRLENTSSGVFNILNSTSSTPNISIIDNGNVGIGTIPITNSSKLEIIGTVNISDNFKKNNRGVINDTSNYILSTRNILSTNIKSEIWEINNNMIYNTSNVGVGTTNPISILHLYDDSNLETKLTIQNSTSSSIELIRGTNNDSNRDYKIGNYNEDFIIKSSLNGSDTNYITITGSTGAITNPTGTTSWTSASDKRIKDNIERASYDKCYESINKLELNRFNYINEFNTVNRDITQLGFIAQEVKEIFPKSVFENSYINDSINIPDLQSIDITQINYSLYGTVKKLIELSNDNKNNIKKIENILNIDLDTKSTSNLILDTI